MNCSGPRRVQVTIGDFMSKWIAEPCPNDERLPYRASSELRKGAEVWGRRAFLRVTIQARLNWVLAPVRPHSPRIGSRLNVRKSNFKCQITILKLSEVKERRCISCSTVCLQIAKRTFPEPVTRAHEPSECSNQRSTYGWRERLKSDGHDLVRT